MTVNLFLARHGEAESNIANHASNKGDFSLRKLLAHKSPSEYRLTEVGIKQSQALGELFHKEGIMFHVFSVSPMLRALETALAATEWRDLGVDAPFVDELLTERSWGNHEYGVPSQYMHDELWATRERNTNLDWRPPGGDSYPETLMRAQVIKERYVDVHKEELVSTTESINIALFTHSEFMWFLERVLTGRTNVCDPKVPEAHEYSHNCAVKHFEFLNGDIRVRSNSKDDLTRFGEWAALSPNRPSRTELHRVLDRSTRVKF